MTGHGSEPEKPQVVKDLEDADDFIEKVSRSYKQIHAAAHTKALDKLVEEGIIKMEDGDYDLTPLDGKEGKGNRDKLKGYMMEHFDKNMKKRLKGWDDLTDKWKRFYMQSVLGITEETLGTLIEKAQKDYNVHTHLQAQDEAYKKIFSQHAQLKLGLAKKEHAKDIFEHYFKMPKDQMEKVKWDQFENNDLMIQEVVKDRLEGQNVTDKKYLKHQTWYKSE